MNNTKPIPHGHNSKFTVYVKQNSLSMLKNSLLNFRGSRGVVLNLVSRSPEGSWTIFGGVANRRFMYTAVLHLLYSSFRWKPLGNSGLV